MRFQKRRVAIEMNGVNDGARTHDNRNHNPGLYQLSYAHHNRDFSRNGALGRTRTCDPRLRRPVLYPVELQAQIGRGRGIRTPDILLPKQARYQTALYPDKAIIKKATKPALNTKPNHMPKTCRLKYRRSSSSCMRKLISGVKFIIL
jgi:hypothetical protein